MSDVAKKPKESEGSNAVFWLAALWVVLVPSIVYCYRHVDKPLAVWVNENQAVLRPFLRWPHNFSDVFFYSLPLVLAIWGFLWWRRSQNRWLGLVFDACVSLTLVLTLKTPIKALFGRTWPETFWFNNPSYLDHGVYGFLPLQWQVAYWAFPSGHTAQIVSISTAVMLHQPKLGWFFVPLSLFVMGDLVALNFHWLSDVLGGVLLGASIAFAVKRFEFINQLEHWREQRVGFQQPRHSSSR